MLGCAMSLTLEAVRVLQSWKSEMFALLFELGIITRWLDSKHSHRMHKN